MLEGSLIAQTQSATHINILDVSDVVLSDPAGQLCFCESTEDPPIPVPIPVADKNEELVRELTVDPSNTSAALRKKISAEDNRPSAVGVRYMGAGLMGTVFGGLFLLDAHVVIQGIEQIVKLIKGTA